MKRLMFSDFRMEVKAVEDDGYFEGYLSTYDLDVGNDKVHPGAFKKTLKERKKFTLLWQHDRMQPIGSFGGKEDDNGLFIKGNMNLDLISSGHPAVPKAHEAHALLKNGDINGLSIGYDVIKDDVSTERGKRIRNIRELRLWEGSVVTFAMNPKAYVTNVKAIDDVRKMILCNQLSVKDLADLLQLQPGDESVVEEQTPCDIKEDSRYRYSKTLEALKKLQEVIK